MTARLNLILDNIEELSAEEREKVREALERLLDDTPVSDDDALLRVAAERGIRVTLPTEPITVEDYDRYEPIRILRGESVSETVIRERR